LASIYSIRGYDTTSLEFLNKALLLASENELSRRKASILANIGMIHCELGNHLEALKHSKIAYELHTKLNPLSRDAAANLINIGKIYQANHDFDNAIQYFNKAKILGVKIEDALITSAALNNLGCSFLTNSDYDKALINFYAALKVDREKQNKRYIIDNLDGIGKVLVAQGQYRKALKIHLQVLKLAQELKLPACEIESLTSLGSDYAYLNQHSEAIKYFVRGLELAQILEHRKKILELHHLLATAYENTNNPVVALFHYKQFHQIEKQVFNKKSEEAIHQLTVKFDLERAERDAKEYQSQKIIAEKAAEEAERLVEQRTHELESSQIEIVMRLAQAAELRDEDTGEHTFRVGRNAAAIAYCLGWAIEDVKLLYLASRLHDVGKIGISDTILLKPGKLTDDEFELMRQHTVIGARILSHGESSLLRMAERIALAHHERWDGYGYPNKLAGNEIPICARIVSVADVIDALTHARPYKKAWSVAEALNEINKNANKQFDPKIADIALTVFNIKTGISPTSTPPDWDTMLKVFKQLFSELRESALSTVNTTNWGHTQYD